MQTFKKVITIFLLAAMLCSLMPAGAIAEEYKENEEESAYLTEEIPDSEESASDPEEVPVEVDADPEEVEEAPEDTESEESGEEAGATAAGSEESKDESEETEVPGTGSEESTGESEDNGLAETLGDDSGEVEEESINSDEVVAKIGDTGYSSLSAAISAASSSATITLVADCTVDSAIKITKNISITNDGENRTIYFCNTNSSSDYAYGRGLAVNNGKTLNIYSTGSGRITLSGHSEDGSNYNYSSVVFASTGSSAGSTAYLTNVDITGCSTKSGGALGTFYNGTYSGSLYLSGCTVSGNSTTNSDGGAAVYCNKGGNIYLQDGTVIQNNCSTSSTSGAIYCTDNASVTISGNVTVKGNKKSCSSTAGVVNADGNDSDIYVTSSSVIKCATGTTGEIGVDYGGDTDGKFAEYVEYVDNEYVSCNSDSTAAAPFFSDISDLKSARFHAGSSGVYWDSYCSFTPNDAKPGNGLCYSFSDAYLSSTAQNLAFSVLVDSGCLTVNSSLLTGASGYALCGDSIIKFDSTNVTDSVADKELSALTVTSGINVEAIQSFIRGIVFKPNTYGAVQNVSFGFSDELSPDTYFFGKFKYTYVKTGTEQDNACAAASSAGGQLISISNNTINQFVTAVSEGNACWTGGSLIDEQWCFSDGTRYSASALSSEGYNGCYTRWADGEPSAGYYMYAENGEWHSTFSGSYGYIIEAPATSSAEASCSVSNPNLKTRLNSYSLELDEGEIAINYFFTFSSSFLKSSGSYVQITIGDESAEKYLVSDIANDANKAEHNSDAYKLTVPVAPKYMNAETLIEFYWGDGTLLGYYGGEGKTSFNVRQYALTVIGKQSEGDAYNSGFSSDLVDLVKAMLNYGAAAENQFKEKNAAATGINSGYVDETDLTSADDITSAYFNNSNSSFSYTFSLFADSTTRLRITPCDSSGNKIYDPDTSKTSNTFSASLNGNTLDSSNGYIEFPVSMQNLGHIYTINFTGSITATLQINVIRIIKALLESDGTSDEAKGTADKLYKMGLAAADYFGTYIPSSAATQAVLNTAYAYLAKTEYTQYDQSRFVKSSSYYSGHTNRRRQLNVSPQDATESNSIYMDCSSFVYNVYREVFGEEAVTAAIGLEEEYMHTWKMIDLTNDAYIASYQCDSSSFSIDTLIDQLQPGDLIVKYRNSNEEEDVDAHGHVVLWVGDGYIHCTGSSYDYTNGVDKIESSGAVKYVKSSSFNSSFYENFDKVTILRPLEALESSPIVSASAARQQLGALAISKDAYVVEDDGEETLLYPGNNVNTGDTVKFTITISNPSLTGAQNTSRTVDIEDTLPEGLKLTEGSLTATKVTIDINAPAKIEYTATVTAEAGSVISAAIGTCRVSGAGSDSEGISFSNIEISVEASSDDIISNIVNNANGKIGKSMPGDAYDTYYVIKSIYSDEISSLQENSAFYDSDEAAWKDNMFHEDSGHYYVYPSGDFWPNALVSNFASGRLVWNYSYGNGRFDTDTRVRNLTSNNLMPGDLLCVYTPSLSVQYRYYIYTGDGYMVSFVPGDVCEKVTADSILGKLPIKTCFAVFRFAGRF